MKNQPNDKELTALAVEVAEILGLKKSMAGSYRVGNMAINPSYFFSEKSFAAPIIAHLLQEKVEEDDNITMDLGSYREDGERFYRGVIYIHAPDNELSFCGKKKFIVNAEACAEVLGK